MFDYTATRERAGPEKFLENYKGYPQADAYVVYDSFFADPERGLVEVGCWTHTRRHFYNERDTDPVRMGAVLSHIALLHAVEGKAREAGIVGDDLPILRQQAPVPWLGKLHEYLEKAGKAVALPANNWRALLRYTGDGDLEIDNNYTERTLRGNAAGRNNWLFVGSDRGGKTMAILRSFVVSWELVKVDAFAWFQDVLVADWEQSIQKLDELLPHRWTATGRLK